MSERVASLELLRGIAALAVATPHYLALERTNSIWNEGLSILAVEIFFVLSGFVLAPQIIATVSSGSVQNLKIFLVRRWVRTIPLYFLSLLIISLLMDHLVSIEFIQYATYTQNLWKQFNKDEYFPIAWSLSIEEWFYIIFPTFGLLAYHFFGAHKNFFLVYTLLFISFITVLRILFGNNFNWGEDVRRVVLFRLDSIAYGFLSFYLIIKFKKNYEKFNLRKFLIALVFLCIIFSGYSGYILYQIATENSYLAKAIYPILASFLGICIVLLFLKLAIFIKSNRTLSNFGFFIGKMSYPIYLFHLIIAILIQPNINFLPIEYQFFIYLPVLFFACAIIHYLFELPILSLRPKSKTYSDNTMNFQ